MNSGESIISRPGCDRAGAIPSGSPAWSADRGDGTYRNPVLFADYSDPDAIRVGEDYWLTSSSFGHVPGLPILHSRDLVNWTLVNHALPKLDPESHFSQPRHGQGVWAPAIRHHGGKFWIFYPDPDFGIYVVTADHPESVWSKPRLIMSGKGLIDPCPYWEADGTGFLIHGWAHSRSGIKNRLTLHRLEPDGLGVLDRGSVVVDGQVMNGWHTIEGPKLYRRAGYYYIFAPAGGVRDGVQAVFRSRHIEGPYENRVVLVQGSTTVNGPHQGAWIDTPGGEHWFIHFQEVATWGRVMHLQPLVWRDDWPMIGRASEADGPGEPVTIHRKPQLPLQPFATPATSDDFDQPRLGLQWQWQGNAQEGWASLSCCPGSLRLTCVARTPGETLWGAAHPLMQKFPAPEFEVTTIMRFSPAAIGDRAGLVVFGRDYAWIGLRWAPEGLRCALSVCHSADLGGPEAEVISISVGSSTLHLRATVGRDGRCQFAISETGVSFTALGDKFQASSSVWVGAKIGLFASGVDLQGEAPGFVDVDWFRVSGVSP